MRKLLLILCFLLVGKFSSFASHIVGGEFEFLHISGNTYRINLIIYFDELNGNQQAKFNPIPLATIFRKRDNVAVRTVQLPFVPPELAVEYSIPACADSTIVETTKLVFSDELVLNPNDFSDPEGYYIVWQRCCRNYNITNVVSQDPQGSDNAIIAGQTFFLEIPPLIKDGERFINSSPRLFPPLSDYACVGREFYADFQGSDDDGDSLVYSLVEPLNTPTATPAPQPPSTAPYPIVQWVNGFGIDNIVEGDPDLSISDDGFLRVTPTLPGIFVFAVKCEEFRDGEKIGELRRDFQMVVVDCQDPGSPPIVEIRRQDNTVYQEGDTIRFLADQEKCVRFSVEDRSNSENDSNRDEVDIRLNPINYDEENFEIMTLPTSTRDRLDVEVCFSDCPPTRDLPFQVDFIGRDRNCPLPLQDTVRLTIAITPPDNDLPVLSHKEDVGRNFSTSMFRSVTVTERVGGIKIIDLLGEDINLDSMDFTFFPQDFELEEVGMFIEERVDSAGRAETALEWNFDCLEFDFDTPLANERGRSEYTLFVQLEDVDECLYEDPILLELKLTVILPPNSAPDVFSTDLGNRNTDYFRIEPIIESTINIDILGEDLDGDNVIMDAAGANFDLASFGANFNQTSGGGDASTSTQISSPFTWPLLCDNFNLAEQDSFRVYFFLEDFDKCEITNQDTLTVDFIIQPTPNTIPSIGVSSLNNLEIVEDTIKLVLDDSFEINVSGFDMEGDSIFIDLISDGGAMGYEFIPGRGVGNANGTFLWTPGCDVFTNDGFKESFELIFAIEDDNCSNPLANQAIVNIEIRDKMSDREFLPPNMFTPNGDKVNDFFGMFELDKENDILTNILPIDNCAGVFEGVRIFNRWGKEVYFSVDRDFRWSGDDVPAGVYFYNIKYTNRDYRGSLSIVY